MPMLRITKHPVLAEGRPDLANEWDPGRNDKSPSDITLGSDYAAWWVCKNDPEHPPWQTMVKYRALQGTGCPACGVANRFKPRNFGPG